MDLKLENSQTFENLKKAFYEEASLAFRYQFFATIAEFEGLDRYVELFSQFAEGGTTNTLGCLDYLRDARDPASQMPLGGSQQNMESVLQTETQQYSEIYGEMAKQARKEGFTDIASWFDTLQKLKRSHMKKLKEVSGGQ